MPEPIAEWNPARSVWETRADLLCGHSGVYSETWPSSGMTRSGKAYERPTLEHRTGGSGSSSLLPTPDSYQGSRGGSQDPAKRAAGGHAVSLQDVTEHLLPTPRVSSANGSSQRERDAGNPRGRLETAMEMLLPTPSAADGNGGGRRGSVGHQTPLPGVVLDLLPTPRATDGTKGGPNQRGSSGDEMLPSAVMTLLPTPTVMDAAGSRNSTAWRSDPDKPVNIGDTLTDFAWKHEGYTDPKLLPTPRVAATRTSRSAAMRRDSMSAPSLDQAIEIAQGILPREFTTADELPPSWSGESTNSPSDAGSPSSDE